LTSQRKALKMKRSLRKKKKRKTKRILRKRRKRRTNFPLSSFKLTCINQYRMSLRGSKMLRRST